MWSDFCKQVKYALSTLLFIQIRKLTTTETRRWIVHKYYYVTGYYYTTLIHMNIESTYYDAAFEISRTVEHVNGCELQWTRHLVLSTDHPFSNHV